MCTRYLLIFALTGLSAADLGWAQEDGPTEPSARTKTVASAVYSVVPMAKLDESQRRQFSQDVAQAFLGGDGPQVDQLLTPYAPEPRTGLSRELILATCHLAAGDTRRGVLALEQAAVFTPDYPDVFIELGKLAFAQRRWSDALAQFEKAERLCKAGNWPAFVTDHFEARCLDGFANVALAQGRLEAAMESLKDLDRLLPDDPSVLKRLGETAFRLQDPESARRFLKDFHQQVPNSPPAEVQIAGLAVRLKKYDEARQWLAEAEDRYHDDQAALTTMAQLSLEMDDAAGADALLKKALESGASTDQIKLLQGQANYILGDTALAARYFEDLSQRHPLNSGYASLYALALAADDGRDRKSLARQVALNNLKGNSQRYEVISVAGWLEYSIGSKLNGEKLLGQLTQELARTGLPIDRDTAYFLASYQADKGQEEAARRLLAEALETHGLFLHRPQAELLLERLNSQEPQ